MSKSKAPLVMLEQMVMLAVFALAAALCLQAFVQSDAISRKSEARDRAVVLCQSAAETLRATGGNQDEAARLALGDGYHVPTSGRFVIPLTEEMTAAQEDEGAYYLEFFASETVLEGQLPGLDGMRVVVWTADWEELFSLEVLWQVEVTA